MVEWIARLPRGRAIDVAMGRGRHAVPLAQGGFHTFGVDIDHQAVRRAVAAGAAAGVVIHGWCADLTQHPLPRSRFDLVLVTRYLQRDLFASIRDAVAPGGAVIYETFTVAQRAFASGPRSPAHLLEPGELRRAFEGFEVMVYEETCEGEAVARIAARKPR